MLLLQLDLPFPGLHGGRAQVRLGLCQPQPRRLGVQTRKHLALAHAVTHVHGDLGDAPTVLERQFRALLLAQGGDEARGGGGRTGPDGLQLDRAQRFGRGRVGTAGRQQ